MGLLYILPSILVARLYSVLNCCPTLVIFDVDTGTYFEQQGLWTVVNMGGGSEPHADRSLTWLPSRFGSNANAVVLCLEGTQLESRLGHRQC
jgi:hypothetical protein